MPRRKLAPIHPGEVLNQEFLSPLGISQYRLAKETSVAPRRINEIVHGARAISADTALRLARYFGTSKRFWLNLQARYDLEIEKDRLGKRLQREVRVRLGPRHSLRQQTPNGSLHRSYPLITPIGRMRATLADSPALCTTSTTSSTFL